MKKDIYRHAHFHPLDHSYSFFGPSTFTLWTVHFSHKPFNIEDRPHSGGPSTFCQKTVHFTRYRPPSEGPSTFRRTVHFPSKDRPLYPVPSTF